MEVAAILKKPVTVTFIPSLLETSPLPIPYTLPQGATYRQTMTFPVLGEQAFQIHIMNDSLAHLSISGMLNIDEVITYRIDLKGRLLFSLSTAAEQILRRFKTKLLEAGYDPVTDTPYVKVAPYVLPAVKIRMPRFHRISH